MRENAVLRGSQTNCKTSKIVSMIMYSTTFILNIGSEHIHEGVTTWNGSGDIVSETVRPTVRTDITGTMSVVTLQMGQCGNQIGGDFFATLMADLQVKGQHCTQGQDTQFQEATLERFFHREEKTAASSSCMTDDVWKARAVMVDMESKVIAQSMTEAKQSGTWRYPEKQQFCQKRGSGNNWAHGFCVHGPNVKEPLLEMVRREVEKCDYFGGFLTLMSLAGGTGSGVGAYATQCLRDEFPHSFTINQVVWPYKMGEVIVQNYNAMLTLSHLYQSADAVITMDNDSLHDICMRLMAMKNVSFRDINKVISHKMASVLQPVYGGVDHSSSTLLRNHLGEMLEHLVPHPEYKLLTMRNIPQMSDNALKYSTFQWPGLMKHLRQMLIANAAMEEGINWQVKASASSCDFNRSLANLLVLRGKDIHACDVSGLADRHLYVPWVPGNAYQTWSHPRAFNQYEKSAVLLSNSQAPVQILDRVVGKAWQMFASRAYVHQYLKHGLTEEDFVDSFAMSEQVVANYKNL